MTNDGKPLAVNSRVVFFNKEEGLTLTGSLDSLGNYSLTAADPKLGVPAGRYEVSILPPPKPVLEMAQGSGDYEKMMKGGATAPAKAGADNNSAQDIPKKFQDPKTSGLVFEVKERPNTFDFDLAKL